MSTAPHHPALTAEALMRKAPVIPVLTIDKVEDAVPLAKALVAGGLPVLEVTLRTQTALEAIAAIAASVPDAIIGAGTIRSAAQAQQARQAGARSGHGIAPCLGFVPELRPSGPPRPAAPGRRAPPTAGPVPALAPYSSKFPRQLPIPAMLPAPHRTGSRPRRRTPQAAPPPADAPEAIENRPRNRFR